MRRRYRDDPPPDPTFDRWLRRASYAAAPVVAAGSIAGYLHMRRLMPSAKRAIEDVSRAARSADEAAGAVTGAARTAHTVVDQVSRSPFLPKPREPGELGHALARSPQVSSVQPPGFLERLRDRVLGLPTREMSAPERLRRFACGPEEALFLRERLRKQREQRKLARVVRFASGQQMRVVGSNTYANPGLASIGEQSVYVKRDERGDPVPMGVPPLMHAQVLRYYWNKGKRVEKGVRRGGGFARDAFDVAAGNPRRTDTRGRPQPREWERPWFRRALGTAALAGLGIGGAAYLRKFPVQGPRVLGKTLPGRADVMGWMRAGQARVNRYIPDYFPTPTDVEKAAHQRTGVTVPGKDLAERLTGKPAAPYVGPSEEQVAAQVAANAKKTNPTVKRVKGKGGQKNLAALLAGSVEFGLRDFIPPGWVVGGMAGGIGGAAVGHLLRAGPKRKGNESDGSDYSRGYKDAARSSGLAVRGTIAGAAGVLAYQSWKHSKRLQDLFRRYGKEVAVPRPPPTRLSGRSFREILLSYAPAATELAYGDPFSSAPDWDVRDQRGRSARVFAPASQPRERRPKHWWERAANQRLLGIAGTGAGLAGGYAVGLWAPRPKWPFRFAPGVNLRSPVGIPMPGMEEARARLIAAGRLPPHAA